ncbi:gem-associated protein 2-like [Impatiens glandulifera]|uniref:gem-associated protein 2-like n=1 Tax=Impatiens glandulifera TaxID=253017 RepID=UPI001FB086BE|nr:gem-associated protein 2-like [Impatiens glandulifera]
MEDVKDFAGNMDVAGTTTHERDEDSSSLVDDREPNDASKSILIDNEELEVIKQQNDAAISESSVKCELLDEIAVGGKSEAVMLQVSSYNTTDSTSNIHMMNKESNEKNKGSKTYSREEIEALRFVDTEAQTKIWTDVYLALQMNVRNEYDRLVPGDSRNQSSSSNLDHRNKQFRQKEGNHQGSRNEMKSSNAHDFEHEEYTEEYDSDDDYVSIQRPAFYVTGEPDFESGPPEDGFEYLRRVRWETSRVPKVKVAKLERNKLKEQTVYMPKIPEIAKCPEHLLPNKQWEDAFLADFSDLRLVLSRLEDSGTEVAAAKLFPKEENINKLLENDITVVQQDFENIMTTEENSNSVCETLDSSASPDNTPLSEEKNDSLNLESSNIKPSSCAQNSSPTMSAIMKMDCVARVSMLRKRISLLENANAISRNDCVWLFALCAAVDTPFDADTSASVRSLLRKICSLRAEKIDMDDDDDMVVMLNILATIAGRYFGQAEY